MYKKILDYIKNESLYKESLILLSSSIILYLTSYLYQFYNSRALGPIDYGILATFFSILYIFGVIPSFIQMSITKFTLEFIHKKEFDKLKYLINRSFIKLPIYFLFVCISFYILNFLISKIFNFSFVDYFISDFLKMPKESFLILFIIMIFYLLVAITRGVLQGFKFFKKLGLNLSLEGLIKLGFAILFVSIGFGVSGAVLALLVSSISVFLLTLWQIRNSFKYDSKKFETKHIYISSIPFFVTFLVLTLIYNLDMILIKHFFEAQEAGYYGVLSTLGKIIYFSTFPIIQVMFPISSEEKIKNKKNSDSLLMKSTLIVFLISSIITLLYFLFPSFIINLLFGKDYLIISNLLGGFGIFMILFSLCNLFAFYNLSINRWKFIFFLSITPFLEILLICLFHESLKQILFSLISLSLITLILLIVYTLFKNDKTFSNNTSIQ